MVTMGCSIDSLDVCFGTQVVDSRGDIGVIYAYGLIHVLVLHSPIEILGVLFDVLCLGLSIMNLKLFDVYRIINSWVLVVTLEYLGDIRVG